MLVVVVPWVSLIFWIYLSIFRRVICIVFHDFFYIIVSYSAKRKEKKKKNVLRRMDVILTPVDYSTNVLLQKLVLASGKGLAIFRDL